MNNKVVATNQKSDSKSFSYAFTSSKPPEAVFELLLDIDKWWSGIYSETIKGESHKIDDEFSFNAGEGIHYSKQKLIELIPDKKIVWLVTDSNLSFLSETSEWTNTMICFDISEEGKQTKVIFTHDGLIPKIECYDACSGAWSQYLEKLEEKLK